MIEKLINSLPKEYQKLVEVKSFDPGEIIINQGDEFRKVFWVKRGLIKAFHSTEKGQEFLVAVFGENETFGELEYFTKRKNFASIETITTSEIIIIPGDVFAKLLNDNSALHIHITTNICDRLSKISQRTIETNYYSLDYLVSAYLINESARLESNNINISKNDMANYFATNLRSINRILKKYSDSEILTYKNNTVNIINIGKLKKVMYDEQN